MLVCMRELLKAARTYYVRTDGSDSNNGLTNDAAGAFLTIQKAVDVVMKTLDLGGFNVTIQVGDGTYTTPVVVQGPQTGTGVITLRGNATTPGNVLISTTSASAITLDRGAMLNVRDLEVRTATSGVGLQLLSSCQANIANVVFGPCVSYHMHVVYNSRLVLGNYTIAGSAQSHLALSQSATVYAVGITVTLSGTPAFGPFLFMETCATFRAESITYVGAATGTRYLIQTNAAVMTYSGASPTYFPGSLPGVAQTGGQYT